ncbi:MAG: hypothetical protein Q8M73_01655, partial [Actinomycetota bacterium]|nr:hypothetical protein [Actinomycetota bacterium]
RATDAFERPSTTTAATTTRANDITGPPPRTSSMSGDTRPECQELRHLAVYFEKALAKAGALFDGSLPNGEHRGRLSHESDHMLMPYLKAHAADYKVKAGVLAEMGRKHLQEISAKWGSSSSTVPRADCGLYKKFTARICSS